ncbi:MAG: AraC family transcriptional regulator [Atopococcus tabaci]|uniref:AraC family transcriptional regulator n=1 Tax=Atopococcus tabaci TaxID=269774 RepID=A0AA43UCR1_9LACT|nr:AraC family transcriptional regulator [Atopococcus tabaci]
MTSGSNIDRSEYLKYLNEESANEDYMRMLDTSSAISIGDQEALKEITSLWYEMEQPLNDSPSDKLTDIEWFQFQMSVLNSYCRLSAEKGSLVRQSNYLISSKYNLLIERGQSIDYLKKYVFYEIFDDYCSAVKNLSTQNLSDVMIEIITYTNDHLTEDLTLPLIADEFDIHPVHLARKFKQETGLTFVEYIHCQRIELAKFLLYLDQYSLSETAYLSGFNSHSYFTKVFKKITGEKPSQFKKSISLIY